MSPSPRAIISITTSGKNYSNINYSRRMYAIIRRYTPDVEEVKINECYADLTGLRTFFKMSYKEIAEKIRKDLVKEIGITFTIRVAPVKSLSKNLPNKNRDISTYKEMNRLFAGSAFTSKKTYANSRPVKKRLVVPFIGKVN